MNDGEQPPHLLDIRKTNTDVPTTASTPGKECLTSLNGLAKGILAHGGIFRARMPRYRLKSLDKLLQLRPKP